MKLFEMEGFLRGKCLPGDMKVNETNAEYLVRKFAALEQQFTESHRKLEKMAAENAGLKTIVSGINNKLCGKGFIVSAWHLNGALKPLDNWFNDNRWGEAETPATDVYLADVRAQARNEGINYAASRLAAAFNHGFVDKPLAEVFDVVRMILTAKEDLANDPLPASDGLSGEYADKFLAEFAAQLRKGAQS